MELHGQNSSSDMRGIKYLEAEIKGTWSSSVIGEKYRLETWKRGNHLSEFMKIDQK
jgi:aspartyl/asparaginyl-tRNA synthetase